MSSSFLGIALHLRQEFAILCILQNAYGGMDYDSETIVSHRTFLDFDGNFMYIHARLSRGADNPDAKNDGPAVGYYNTKNDGADGGDTDRVP